MPTNTSRVPLSVVTLVLAALLTSAVTAQEEPTAETIFSGPQPGEPLSPFTIRGILGPGSGEEFDLVSRANGQPIVLVFVHERTRPAFGLANIIMSFAASRESKGLQRGLVFLSDDATEAEAWLKRIPKYFEQQTPVGLSVDGIEGPGTYGLNRNVAMTILVGNDSKTTANFALVQPSIQADGPKILKAIVEATGGGDVPDITKFLPREMRERMQPAGRDAKLAELLRAVIQKDATDAAVATAAKAVDEYVQQTPAARVELGDIAKRISTSDRFDQYGTPAARVQIEAWAKKYAPPQPSDKADPAPKTD